MDIKVVELQGALSSSRAVVLQDAVIVVTAENLADGWDTSVLRFQIRHQIIMWLRNRLCKSSSLIEADQRLDDFRPSICAATRSVHFKRR